MATLSKQGPMYNIEERKQARPEEHWKKYCRQKVTGLERVYFLNCFTTPRQGNTVSNVGQDCEQTTKDDRNQPEDDYG